ncbi:MAG: hypothetical protein WAU07_02180 [Microgenomates group bacterium]
MYHKKKANRKFFFQILFAGTVIGIFVFFPSILGLVSAAIGQFFWNNEPVSITLPKDSFQASEKFEAILEHAKTDDIRLAVKNSSGQEYDVDAQLRQVGENVVVTILPTSSLSPGKYSLVVADVDGAEVAQKQFWWGVLAINTNQSVYKPDEEVDFSIGVLDSQGEMVCDAIVSLEIIHQESSLKHVLSTENGEIGVNQECEVYGLTFNPDYAAKLKVGEIGLYTLRLQATTAEGTYAITDSFEVQESPEFIVTRNTATRIYPVVEYPVQIEVTPQKDFAGTITETVPASFAISVPSSSLQPKITDTALGKKEIRWDVHWKANQTYLLEYNYDAPDVSPELYTIGPATFTNMEDFIVFQETRLWSIAVDAVTYDAVTTSTSASFSHTTSGSDRVLLVYTYAFNANVDPDVTGITYNGVSMSKVTESSIQYVANRYIEVQVWQLVAPATGSNTVSITYAGTYTKTSASAISFTGVDQSTPIGSSGTNSSTNAHPSVTFSTTNSNSIIVGGSLSRGGDTDPFTPGMGVTERWDFATGVNVNTDLGLWGGQKDAPTATSYTIDSTGAVSDAMVIAGVELNEAVSGVTISGVVYNAGTSTALTECDGSTSNIALRAGSSTFTTTCDNATGAFSFTGLTAPSAGDGLILWIDGEATDGAMVLRYDGTGDSTGHVFYDETVVITSDDATAVDTTDMDFYDSSNDADIPYTVTSGNVTIASGHTLMIASSKTFDPGGTVITNATGGTLHLDDTATAYLDTATNTIGADILIDTGATLYINADTNIDGGDITLTGTGAVTTNVGTPTVTISGGGTIGGASGTLAFHHVTLDQTGTTVLDSSLTTTNLTIGDGSNARTLDIETNDDAVDVNGDFTIATSGTYQASSTTPTTIAGDYVNDGTLTEGTGTIVLDGASNSDIDPGCTTLSSCTEQNFYTLTISKTSGATEVSLLSSNLRTINSFNVTTGTFVQGSQDVLLEGVAALTVPIGSTYSNTSTGDITLGSGISIGGTMTVQGNGSTCGQADDIVIDSTDGTQRAWTGAGTFNVNDVTVSDMDGTATIVAFSSTNNGNLGSNWDVQSGCGGGPVNSELLRHGGWFSGDTDQPFTF